MAKKERKQKVREVTIELEDGDYQITYTPIKVRAMMESVSELEAVKEFMKHIHKIVCVEDGMEIDVGDLDLEEMEVLGAAMRTGLAQAGARK